MKLKISIFIAILASQMFVSPAFAWCVLGLGNTCKVQDITNTNKTNIGNVTSQTTVGDTTTTIGETSQTVNADIIKQFIGSQDPSQLFIPLTSASTKQIENSERIFKEFRETIKELNKSNQDLLKAQAEESRKFTEQLVKQVIGSPPTIPIVSASSSFPINYPTNSITTPFYVKDIDSITNFNNLNNQLTNMSNFITGGGTSTSDATTKSITQTAHGFVVGNWVYLSGASTYAKTDADATATLDSVGVVTTVTDANIFTLTTEGYASGLSGLTAGTRYYISGTAGAITSTAPTNSKAVFIADTTTSGYVQQYGASAAGAITPLANFSLSAISTVSITGTIRNLTTPIATNANTVLPTTTRLGLTSAVLTLNTPAIVTNSSNITVGSDALTFTQAGRYQAVASVNPLGIGVNHAFFIQAVKNGTTVVGFGVGQPGGGNSTDQATVEINTDFAIGDTLDFRIASNQSTGITQGATSITVNQLPTSVSVPVDVVPEFGENNSITNGQTIAGGSGFVNVTGGSFTLPSAGTWDVTYNVFSQSTTSGFRARYQLVKNSDSSVVPNSYATTVFAAGNYIQEVTQTVRIITTGAEIYKLQGFADNGTVTIFNSTGEGNTKVNWTKASGFTPSSGQTVDYVGAERRSADVNTNLFTIPSTNGTTFGTLLGTANRINLTSATVSGNLAVNGTNGTIAIANTGAYTITTNVSIQSAGTTGQWGQLVKNNATVLTASAAYNQAAGAGLQIVLTYTGNFTAGDLIDVRVNSTAAGTIGVIGYSYNVTQIGSTSNTVGTLPANDQSAAGYFDIGNMRMQWGTHNDGNVDTTTVTLPAAFANTNYSVVATSNTSAGSLDTESKTTTTFDIDRASTTVTTQLYSWFAIGQKP